MEWEALVLSARLALIVTALLLLLGTPIAYFGISAPMITKTARSPRNR